MTVFMIKFENVLRNAWWQFAMETVKIAVLQQKDFWQGQYPSEMKLSSMQFEQEIVCPGKNFSLLFYFIALVTANSRINVLILSIFL